jgi:hypothetical protein
MIAVTVKDLGYDLKFWESAFLKVRLVEGLIEFKFDTDRTVFQRVLLNLLYVV